MILLPVIFQDKYKDLDSHYVEGKTGNVLRNKEFKYVQGCEVLTEGKVYSKFYVFLTVHPCIISQINTTTCTILFNTFIYFSSLHVSGVHAPIIRRKLLYLCDTCTCHSVWVAASGMLVGLKSNQQTRRHPYRVINTSFA